MDLSAATLWDYSTEGDGCPEDKGPGLRPGGPVLTCEVKLTFVLFTLRNSLAKLGHPAAVNQTIPETEQ